MCGKFHLNLSCCSRDSWFQKSCFELLKCKPCPPKMCFKKMCTHFPPVFFFKMQFTVMASDTENFSLTNIIIEILRGFLGIRSCWHQNYVFATGALGFCVNLSPYQERNMYKKWKHSYTIHAIVLILRLYTVRVLIFLNFGHFFGEIRKSENTAF